MDWGNFRGSGEDSANRGAKYRKWLKKENLIVLVLVGILLFIIALPTKKGGQEAQGQTSGAAVAESTGEQEKEGLLSEKAYVEEMEERLQKILASMAGVGKVQVMITVKSSGELIVEKEHPVSRSATQESDAQGGSRVINQVETKESTVYKTESGSSEPYVVKTLTPEIEGVLVVAEGAGSGTVNKNITEIVQALFDVEAHKVKVVKMQ